MGPWVCVHVWVCEWVWVCECVWVSVCVCECVWGFTICFFLYLFFLCFLRFLSLHYSHPIWLVWCEGIKVVYIMRSSESKATLALGSITRRTIQRKLILATDPGGKLLVVESCSFSLLDIYRLWSLFCSVFFIFVVFILFTLCTQLFPTYKSTNYTKICWQIREEFAGSIKILQTDRRKKEGTSVWTNWGRLWTSVQCDLWAVSEQWNIKSDLKIKIADLFQIKVKVLPCSCGVRSWTVYIVNVLYWTSILQNKI